MLPVGGAASQNAGETIKVTDESGNTILEYSPKGSFSAAVITSPLIETGKTYSFLIGSESYTAEISEQNTVIGTVQSTNSGKNKFMR